jgi:choline-glycine betaine transporter
MTEPTGDPVAVHLEMAAEAKDPPEATGGEDDTQNAPLQYDDPTSVPDAKKGSGSGKLGLREFSAGPFTLNPFVTIVGAAVLWGFAIWCIDDQEYAIESLNEWKLWVTETFSWYYIGTQNIWIIFMVVVLYYHGDKKLGKDNERPEFSDVTYFAMVFSTGVAIGLVVYGTAEPLYHYDYWVVQRFNADEGVLDNDKANWAMLTTIFHWGLHGWVPYALVGVQLGIMSFRHGLPLLMRSAFYPILGKHTWGWIGDAIDAFTIITVVSGVCTSLGLGVWQITVGFQGLDWLPDPCDGECKRDVYLAIIWGITVIATVSVVSGLGNGIKTLSYLAVVSAGFIWLLVTFLGDTWFYANNITQSVGYYAQYSMTQLGWHVDAFAQLGWGAGGSPDQQGAGKTVEGYGFMDQWTIFYWGWWIAWCPFVGMFIARISRGRTVKEVILYSLGGPLVTSMLWFGVFGGMAISMENNAQLLWQAGSDLYNDPTTFQTGLNGHPQVDFKSSYINGAIDSRDDTGGFGTSGGRCGSWAVDPLSTSACVFDNATGTFLNNNTACVPLCGPAFSANEIECVPVGAVDGASKACGACFVQQATFDRDGKTGCEIFEANPKNKGKACPKYIQHWQGNMELSPVCLFTDWDQEASWFHTMGQFGGKLAPFLQVFSIISLILFFITSSDSGSLVVDTLAANGRLEASTLQRVFWAFTEGGLATGLVAGADVGKEKNVLKALQAASICTGLPFTLMLCFVMPALWRGFNLEALEQQKTWKTPIYGGIFDTMETILSLGKSPLPVGHITKFFVQLCAPFLAVHKIASQSSNEICGSKSAYAAAMAGLSFICFICWIVLLAVNDDGLWGIGWVMYFCLAIIISIVRRQVRVSKGITGNAVEDFSAALFMYPNALVQAVEALDEDDLKSE